MLFMAGDCHIEQFIKLLDQLIANYSLLTYSVCTLIAILKMLQLTQAARFYFILFVTKDIIFHCQIWLKASWCVEEILRAKTCPSTKRF